MLKMTYQILYLGSPLLLVALASGFCVKFDWLRCLKRPLDLGRCFRGRRIFGDHKSWRGFILNVFFCVLGTIIQTWLTHRGFIPAWFPLLDYGKFGYLAGVLLGTGMTFGEMPNSFLKRQLAIPPGNKKKGPLGIIFFLFDQVDLTIGIWVFLFLLVRPSLTLVLWSFLLTFVLHIMISVVGYSLGMRETIL